MTSLVPRLLSFVKFEHTIFALPFAYAGMLLAAEAGGEQVTFPLVLWITVAMVGARTLAMALNRLIDAGIDARNPRTAVRELPSGTISRGSVYALCAVSLGLLLLATTQLDPITQMLWPIPVVLFLLYPYTKRFTWLCHLVLGITIGLAPLAAWLAVRGDLDATAVWLTVASALWIAGFDVIYATQDITIDSEQGLYSLPARFGIARALLAVRVMHVLVVAALVMAGLAAGLGVIYWLGVFLVAGLLGYENAIVKPDDLSRVNAAFFTTNGVIGIIFIVAVIGAVLVD